MAEYVVPVDVDALVYSVLSAAFPTTDVGALPAGDARSDPELPYIGFTVISGNRLNQITDAHHIVIRAWAATHKDASALCRRAFAVLLAAPWEGPATDAVRKTDPVGLPVDRSDVGRQVFRFQGTVEWQTRPEIQA